MPPPKPPPTLPFVTVRLFRVSFAPLATLNTPTARPLTVISTLWPSMVSPASSVMVGNCAVVRVMVAAEPSSKLIVSATPVVVLAKGRIDYLVRCKNKRVGLVSILPRRQPLPLKYYDPLNLTWECASHPVLTLIRCIVCRFATATVYLAQRSLPPCLSEPFASVMRRTRGLREADSWFEGSRAPGLTPRTDSTFLSRAASLPQPHRSPLQIAFQPISRRFSWFEGNRLVV